MIKPIRNIHYIGKESDFSKEVNDYFEVIDAKFFNYNFIYNHWENLFESIMIENTMLFIVDLSEFKSRDEMTYAYHFISSLRKSQAFKKVPIALIFDTEELLSQNDFFMALNVQYFHVIGDDIKLFLNNIYYIMTEDDSHIMKFAHAKGFSLESYLFHSAFVSKYDYTYLEIDTDIKLDSTETCSIKNFNNNDPVELEFLEMVSSSGYTNMLFSFNMSFVFNNSWGAEEGKMELFPDTVETWIAIGEEDKELKQESKKKILLVSNTQEHISTIFQLFIKNKIEFYHFLNIDESNLENITQADLIIYDVCPVHTDQSVDELGNLLTYLEENNESSIVLINNHPSKIDALKKLYFYDKLLDINFESHPEIFVKMVQLISNKNKLKHSFFSKDLIDQNNCISIKKDISITSLTENEITFKSSHEIPLYSIVEFELPIKFLAILIPTYMNLSKNLNGFHYHALIMGIEEDARQKLRHVTRKFINSKPSAIVSYDKMFEESEQKEVITDDIEIDNDSYVTEDKKQKKKVSLSNFERIKSKFLLSKL